MLVGRQKELEILNKAALDDKSHFIAIYGRRRIGKTFLVREAYNYSFTFSHAGLSNGSMKEQLYSFYSSLKDAGLKITRKPKNWLEAFDYLKDLIRQSTEKKKVIFLDELSWMDTARSDLMMALESFWNGFASARKDVVLIVCASATSWILSKVIHNKGGLYNRLTEQIHLEPFDLNECLNYVSKNNLCLNKEQILQFYMIFGGVPYYWDFIKKEYSLVQNIDNMLFKKDAPLKDEYQYLYASIFRNPENYLKIIEALANKKIGLTRDEIIKETGIGNTGSLSNKLEELEVCGFIRKYNVLGNKKKNALYQLIDPYTLFYHHFLKNYPSDEHFWTNQINTPKINSWMGLAFERLCFSHIKQIKKKLGIASVLTEVYSWKTNADLDKGLFGSQIDMLIVRKDQVINLCEIKYSNSQYVIDKETDLKIKTKMNDFIKASKTKYAIMPTLITTYGLVDNAYSSIINYVVCMEDLFES